MEKNLPVQLQEVIFGSSDKKVSKQVSNLEKAGKIRKIAPRIYTSNLDAPPEIIIKRNLFEILSNLYPEAMLSHRSALEFKPTESGNIFLTYSYTKNVNLPGITICFLKGPKPLETDNLFFGNLKVSQRERAFLENLEHTKNSGTTSKCLTQSEIEGKLELIIRTNGESELNEIRDRAKGIAVELNMLKEFERLNKIIGALLSTYSTKILTSETSLARAMGAPYDPVRLKLFEELFSSLQKEEFKYLIDQNNTDKSFRNFAFFESYFSNYIEGTVFEVEEAREIIESNKPLVTRQGDSHDILGTYRLVSNKMEIAVTPVSAEEFLLILSRRHQILLSARHDKNPGKFKDRNNMAGQTAFVDFKLVRGTLIKCFDFYQALRHPFSKAAYMMFVVSEIHPFLDGNGRIARILMNSELVNQGQSKIIIPTVFRDDYLGALRKLTRQSISGPYINMLKRAQEFSANIYGDDMDEMLKYLQQCNAFSEPTEAALNIISRS